ncbi:hypothetical protein M7I_6781 [Glarea lozoyensis 74030]|uniref:Ring-like domain-containing protein n=1 Tax=Glarea lozoyensis (strain ATCC 74030 / MF5533) TaxID=1104152 RepID=H0EVI3_GLAL7|nr:hypothetical protein M7I_6781 [Glarea lozoyensis 74030]
MLEYFTYKKVKKHQDEKKGGKEKETMVKTPPPLLNDEDEAFLTRIVSAEGTPPPLPTRPNFGAEAGDSTGNDAQMVVHDGREDHDHHRRHSSQSVGKGKGKEKETEVKKENKITGFLGRTFTKRGQRPDLKPKSNVPEPEAQREEDDLTAILDDLDLTATNNRAFSLSAESQELVRKFNVVFKDLINGVPTADGTLSKNYEKMPSFMQKLVTSLPDKLTKNLAPELLAVAAESQGLKAGATAAGGAGLKSFFTPSTLKDLVTKPGAVMSAFKAIMNALKLRWPAFMGTNVLLSLGLFVLMFFFWYCHKRGREVRIERENAPVDANGRIIEVDEAGPSRSGPSSPRRHHSDDSRDHKYDDPDEEAAALERRKARRAAHEREKEEKRRAERRDERDHEDSSRHHSRPSSSRHGSSSKLKADERDRDGRRSRSSRESRESRDSRDRRH